MSLPDSTSIRLSDLLERVTQLERAHEKIIAMAAEPGGSAYGEQMAAVSQEALDA